MNLVNFKAKDANDKQLKPIQGTLHKKEFCVTHEPRPAALWIRWTVLIDHKKATILSPSGKQAYIIDITDKISPYYTRQTRVCRAQYKNRDLFYYLPGQYDDQRKRQRLVIQKLSSYLDQALWENKFHQLLIIAPETFSKVESYFSLAVRARIIAKYTGGQSAEFIKSLNNMS